MNKNKQQLLVAKKQRLIRRIERQRQELAETSSDWLHTTAPYDRAWQTIMTFRPLVIAATGLLSVYSLRKPQKITAPPSENNSLLFNRINNISF